MRNYIHGVLVTCDRCGKKRFIRGNLGAYGWHILFGKDICPKCNEELVERLDEFMDVEDSELYFAMIDQFMKEKSVDDVKYMRSVSELFTGIVMEVILNDKNSTEN